MSDLEPQETIMPFLPAIALVVAGAGCLKLILGPRFKPVDAWTGELVPADGSWFDLPDGSRYRILSADHHVGSFETGGWYIQLESEYTDRSTGERVRVKQDMGPLWTNWSMKHGTHVVMPS